MPKYVVVDENNNWLDYGERKSPQEALEEAKEWSDLYNEGSKIFVFKIVAEWETNENGTLIRKI